MKSIYLSNHQGRCYSVSLAAKVAQEKHHYSNEQGQQAKPCRLIKSTLKTDYNTLIQASCDDDLAQQLIDSDPEIDFEAFGKKLSKTSRVYLNAQNQPVSDVTFKAFHYDADGELINTCDFEDKDSNINTDLPLQWTGEFIAKKQAYNQYVFSQCHQLKHVDSASFDFLYGMAKKLDEKQALLCLAAGENADEPLLLTKNGTAYGAFLEGRINGDQYLLLLHLTNMDLTALV